MLSVQYHDNKKILSVVTVILHYLIAAVFIINQNSIWRFLDTTTGIIDDYILLILLALVAACIILKIIINPALKSSTGFMKTAFILLYMAVFIVLDYFYPYYYFEFVTGVFALGLYYFVCNDHEFPEVLTAYRNIIIVIAAASVLIWLFCLELRLIPPTGTVVTGWSNYGYIEVDSYFGICYETQYFWVGSLVFVRNSAFFAEAPMASLAFTISLLIELLVSRKTRLFRVIILYVALLTTFSATGIVICSVVILIKLIKGFIIPRIRKIKSSSGKAGLISAMILIIIFLSALILSVLLRKMYSYSPYIRLDDFRAGIKAWLDAPVVGNGFMNDLSLQPYMSEWRGDNLGYSNSALQLLAHGGLYLGAVYIVPFAVGIIRSIRSRHTDRLIFIICTAALLFLAIFTYTYTIVFLLYFFAFGDNAKISDT